MMRTNKMAERKKVEKKDLKKRARIEALLKDRDSVGYYDEIIAEKADCHRVTVLKVRRELEERGEISPQKERKMIDAAGVTRVKKVATGSRAKKPAKGEATKAKASRSADGRDVTAAGLLEECRDLARGLTANLAQLAAHLGDQGEERGAGKAA
jgi:hypothetical protein